jgi:hypothetical protein
MLPIYIVTGLLFFAPPGAPASSNVQQMLEGYLSQPDLKEPPDTGQLGDRLDVIRSAPVAEARGVLPVALALLRSDNPAHQSIGSLALVALALRQDSAELLGPSLPELVNLLDAHDRTHGGTALGFLALLNPKPPATLVGYLLPRLLDTRASNERLLALSATLMRAAPDDPAVIGALLNMLQEHSGPDVKGEIVRLMGASHTTNERAIAFVGAALADPDSQVRLMAVQAVGWQGPEVIRRYEGQLRKVAADPAEQSSTRDFASMALKKLESR